MEPDLWWLAWDGARRRAEEDTHLGISTLRVLLGDVGEAACVIKGVIRVR